MARVPEIDPKQTRALIVEDSRTQLEDLRFLLEGAGFYVVAEANGVEALASARANTFDLVISDVVMPKMDGYALCAALRADERLRHVPVILLTGLADPKDVIKGLEAGASNFIRKPYEPSYLLARIQSVLATEQLRRAARPANGLNVHFRDRDYSISQDRLQVLDVLLSTYDDALYHVSNRAESSISGATILVVEDSPTQAQRIRFVLEECGFAVSLATNGKEGLQSLRRQPADLVISDVVMPDMDGYEFCKAIRGDRQLSEIPVILVTALTDPHDLIAGLEAGATNFIRKPFDDGYLAKRVRNLLNIQTARRKDKAEPGIDLVFANQKYNITADRKQMLDLLVSSYDSAVNQNAELIRTRDDLRQLNDQLETRVAERTAELRTEIEEHKRAESDLAGANARIDHLNVLLKAIRNINQLIVREKDPGRLIQEACEHLVGARGYRAAWGVIDAGGETALCGRAGWGEEFDEFVQKSETGWAAPCLTHLQASPGGFAVVDPLTSCVGCPLAGRHDGHLAACASISHEDRHFGLLAAAFPASQAFDEEEESLLREVAGDLGIALHDLATDKARRESEGDYRALFENMMNGMAHCRVIFDGDRPVDFVYLSVNPAFETLTGLKNPVGQRVSVLIPGIHETDPEVLAIYARVVKTGKPEKFERQVKSMDMWFAVSAYSAGGDEFVALFDVITDRKRSEILLAESLSFNESLLRTIPFPMDVVDQEGRILFISEAMRRVVGEQSLGKNCWTSYRDDRTQCLSCPLKSRIEEGVTNVVESNGVFGGRLFEIFHTGMTFRGKPALLEIFNDVTERKRLQTQVAQSDRLATMGMLAAGVAHEINNPLSYVLFNLQSLSEEVPKLREAGAEASNPALFDDVMSRLGEALSGSTRIKEITRALGTFSRVEQTDVTPVQLHAALDHAISMGFNEIKYRARLVKDFGQLPMVLASDGKLAQVFLNLLVNAAHSISEGDVEHNEIRVRTWADGDQAYTEISDTGCGIPADLTERVFEPFFTTKEVGIGSGLGLSICRNIISGFNGDISFTSELRKGSRFVVRLPAAPGSHAPAKAESQAPAAAPSPRGRILVVDDEAPIRGMLKRLLARDHDVVIAGSGDEAMRILENDEAFDLLFFDLMMPQMSGMDLHEWLARRKQSLADRVVFVTGGVFTPKAADYLGKIGNPRIDKPFDMAGFRNTVNELMRAAKAKH